MSDKIEKTTVLEDDLQAINGIMHEFYELLPGNEVANFDLGTASPEKVAAFRAVIDQAQEKAEAIEEMRLRVSYEFTRGDLEKIGTAKKTGYATLQKIAMTNGVNAKQTREALIEALVGANKSIKPDIQRERVFKRMAWARNQAEYLHPRQIAAQEARASSQQ